MDRAQATSFQKIDEKNHLSSSGKGTRLEDQGIQCNRRQGRIDWFGGNGHKTREEEQIEILLRIYLSTSPIFQGEWHEE